MPNESNSAANSQPLSDRHPHPPAIAPNPASPTATQRRLPHSRWGFWVPLAMQTLLIGLIPAQALYTMAVGKPVVLQTMPVDPSDFFRGYYVTLTYDISNMTELETVPGAEEAIAEIQQNSQEQTSPFDQAVDLYVVLEAPDNATNNPPTPWVPVAVHRDRPTNLPANQVALHGVYRYNRIIYDLERYYMPEEQRHDINDRIANVQQQTATEEDVPFVVEVRVGAQGNAVATGFWLEDAFFRF
ncbi:GDYXXLXY domain-containing protein [Vacuolonema iberomarrocanum]|uniref:GDYXXLXY domain-containing protein n=1 Tax=Vacuolonema iberomarrocanum TaxID=3454632 RepID=UPI0019E07D7C|nr:GDYXXLXY domain-containing protein [filamentous cyanobacterium LEGE 07170]